MARLILFLYRVVFNIVIWPACLYIFRHPNFKGAIAVRFGRGLPEIPEGRKVLWLHASSVGEVKAVSGLIERMKKDRENLFICLTVGTATGRDVAGRIKGVDLIMPFPFDLKWVMRRYMDWLSPEALIVVETEIWPNLIMVAKDKGVHVIFVNARMSKGAFDRYAMVSSFMKMILNNTHVFSIAHEDAARFSALVAGDVRDVRVVGNLKLDSMELPDLARRESLRQRLGISDRPVFIAGSIREGEEKYVIDAIKYASLRIPRLFSIVAPRHPNRVGYITDMVNALNMRWGLKSSEDLDVDFIIVDTFGELFDLYGASDVAFVGGSLIDLGGQNILEPVAWGVPTIHGAYMDNFIWAVDVVDGFTIQVDNPDEMGKVVCKVFDNIDSYQDMAIKARKCLKKASGVTDQYMDALSRYFR